MSSLLPNTFIRRKRESQLWFLQDRSLHSALDSNSTNQRLNPVSHNLWDTRSIMENIMPKVSGSSMAPNMQNTDSSNEIVQQSRGPTIMSFTPVNQPQRMVSGSATSQPSTLPRMRDHTMARMVEGAIGLPNVEPQLVPKPRTPLPFHAPSKAANRQGSHDSGYGSSGPGPERLPQSNQDGGSASNPQSPQMPPHAVGANSGNPSIAQPKRPGKDMVNGHPATTNWLCYGILQEKSLLRLSEIIQKVEAYHLAKGNQNKVGQTIRASLHRGPEFVICDKNGDRLPPGKEGYYRIATMAEFEDNKRVQALKPKAPKKKKKVIGEEAKDETDKKEAEVKEDDNHSEMLQPVSPPASMVAAGESNKRAHSVMDDGADANMSQPSQAPKKAKTTVAAGKAAQKQAVVSEPKDAGEPEDEDDSDSDRSPPPPPNSPRRAQPSEVDSLDTPNVQSYDDSQYTGPNRAHAQNSPDGTLSRQPAAPEPAERAREYTDAEIAAAEALLSMRTRTIN